MLYVHELFLSNMIILQFHTEHGNDTAMLCAKFQNDQVTKTDVMEEGFHKMQVLRWVSDPWIPFIVTVPSASITNKLTSYVT